MSVYLDYAASTPLDPRVGEAMAEAAKLVGNPSATHSFGRLAREAVDSARDRAAAFLGVEETEITFTSGATEANNAAILGVIGAIADKYPGRKLRALASPFEHASVELALQGAAGSFGLEIDRLPLDGRGVVDVESAAKLLRPDTVMISCMAVNNVLGSIQPIAGLRRAASGEIARRGGGSLPLLVMTDAVQAAARTEMKGIAAAADILTLSAHKMYGPKGIGALILKRGVPFLPRAVGGGQEEGRRSGTENVSGIAGFGRACLAVVEEREGADERARNQAGRILDGLGSVRGIRFLGAEVAAPGMLFLQSDRFNGNNLALKLDAAGFAVSTGSACDSGHRRPPAALKVAFGEQAASRGGIRISWGRLTADRDIAAFVDTLREFHG
jgi:cysteine desulfurase